MSGQRLPLPGEQPRSIWRPRQRKTTPRLRIRWRLIGWVVAAVILAGGVGVWIVTGVPVTVMINGASVELRTHASDVGGAVQAAGVSPQEMVYVFPAKSTPLQAGMVITVGRLLPVIVHADGQTRLVEAHSLSPQAIAAESGFPFEAGDEIRIDRAVRFFSSEIAANPALASAPVIPREITIARARTVVVTQNGASVSFQTTADTLGEALDRAGYVLYEGDQVDPPLDTLIPAEGIQVSIIPATLVTVQADGQQWQARTRQATVAGLVGELGLVVNPEDYVLPSGETPIIPAMTVRVVRAHETTSDERIPIPYQTTFVPDPDMELDQQREVQPGQEGVLLRRSIVRVEDGQEVSRVVTAEWVAEPPRARVVAYGTRIVIRVLRQPEGNFKYWRKLRVLATSYSPSNASDKKPGDPRYGLSGTGAPVRRGVVAVDTRVISLGTHLYVPGYGVGTALDVGGAVKGLRIDLGYEDPLPKLWNDWTDLYLLLPVPPSDQIIWVIPAFTPEDQPTP